MSDGQTERHKCFLLPNLDTNAQITWKIICFYLTNFTVFSCFVFFKFKFDIVLSWEKWDETRQDERKALSSERSAFSSRRENSFLSPYETREVALSSRGITTQYTTLNRTKGFQNYIKKVYLHFIIIFYSSWISFIGKYTIYFAKRQRCKADYAVIWVCSCIKRVLAQIIRIQFGRRLALFIGNWQFDNETLWACCY